MEEVAGCGIVRANGLGARASAAAIKPCREDAGVVEYQHIAGPQQGRKVAEQAVGVLAAGPLQLQHAGLVARGKRLLSDEFVRKVEVEVRNQHGVRL